MRIGTIVLAAILTWPAIAGAQELSNNMTCDEAIAYFERNRQIEIDQNGTVLPISEGTPIREANVMTCQENENRFDAMVPTKDKRECVIAVYCE